jgi:hypothetical protein
VSHNLYTYGSLDPISFKLTLNGVGVSPTLATADIMLVKDQGTAVSIKDECVAHGTMVGVFRWKPTLEAQTQAKELVINMKDADGTDFDENCLILAVGMGGMFG